MATLAELYLKDRGGSVTEYHLSLEQGQRLGQAFFNSLSGTDQERVRATVYDTFLLDKGMAELRIRIAIEHLLETEDDPEENPVRLFPQKKD